MQTRRNDLRGRGKTDQLSTILSIKHKHKQFAVPKCLHFLNETLMAL